MADTSYGTKIMRKGYTAFAALLAASLLATPLVMSADNALATAEDTAKVATTISVQPVAVAPVAAQPAAEICARKARVVYSGYGTPPAANSKYCRIF